MSHARVEARSTAHEHRAPRGIAPLPAVGRDRKRVQENVDALRTSDHSSATPADKRGLRKSHRWGAPVSSGITPNRQEQDRLARKAAWEAAHPDDAG